MFVRDKRGWLIVAVFAMTLLAVPSTAFAADIESLSIAYTNALQGYENALGEREQNADEIKQVVQEIASTDQAVDRAQGELNETSAVLYKETRTHHTLFELILGSESFQDAVIRYDLYAKVERRCADRVKELAADRDELAEKREQLEARKVEIESKVEEAKRAAEEAEKALLAATHADGAEYHQVQGNGSNCGVTAFLVGVNILLNENRFTDNVKEWKSDSFDRDSTANLAAKGEDWLEDNDLSDIIEVTEVEGDVTKASQMKSLLDEGDVVIISSGSGSEWQLADGTKANANSHAEGHWVVFYRCEDNVFYCNDSSTSADKGAGCPYTKKQMQQWLDGRSYHFATVLHKK